MIGFLAGEVLAKNTGSVIIKTSGIGWEVNTPFYSEYEINESVQIWVYTHVRETEISLWGFKTQSELTLFKILIGISGIGPRSAQNLLFQKGEVEIKNSIAKENASGLKIPGIGVKTAEKIILELKGKFSFTDVNSGQGDNSDNSIVSEATSALLNLGYNVKEVNEAIKKIMQENKYFNSVEEIIKEALKRI